MKHIFFILIVFLTGCTSDEVNTSTEQCNCFKYTEIKYNYYNSNTSTNWTKNGAKTEYSNDCDDDEKVIGGYSTQNSNYETLVRYVVECE